MWKALFVTGANYISSPHTSPPHHEGAGHILRSHSPIIIITRRAQSDFFWCGATLLKTITGVAYLWKMDVKRLLIRITSGVAKWCEKGRLPRLSCQQASQHASQSVHRPNCKSGTRFCLSLITRSQLWFDYENVNHRVTVLSGRLNLKETSKKSMEGPG